MLKITERRSSNGHRLLLHLEGRVVGAWVAEVRSCCEEHLSQGGHVALDVTEISFVDRQGILLFLELMGRGVELINCSVFLAEQLQAAKAPNGHGNGDGKGTVGEVREA